MSIKNVYNFFDKMKSLSCNNFSFHNVNHQVDDVIKSLPFPKTSNTLQFNPSSSWSKPQPFFKNEIGRVEIKFPYKYGIRHYYKERGRHKVNKLYPPYGILHLKKGDKHFLSNKKDTRSHKLVSEKHFSTSKSSYYRRFKSGDRQRKKSTEASSNGEPKGNKNRKFFVHKIIWPPLYKYKGIKKPKPVMSDIKVKAREKSDYYKSDKIFQPLYTYKAMEADKKPNLNLFKTSLSWRDNDLEKQNDIIHKNMLKAKFERLSAKSMKFPNENVKHELFPINYAKQEPIKTGMQNLHPIHLTKSEPVNLNSITPELYTNTFATSAQYPNYSVKPEVHSNNSTTQYLINNGKTKLDNLNPTKSELYSNSSLKPSQYNFKSAKPDIFSLISARPELYANKSAKPQQNPVNSTKPLPYSLNFVKPKVLLNNPTKSAQSPINSAKCAEYPISSAESVQNTSNSAKHLQNLINSAKPPQNLINSVKPLLYSPNSVKPELHSLNSAKPVDSAIYTENYAKLPQYPINSTKFAHSAKIEANPSQPAKYEPFTMNLVKQDLNNFIDQRIGLSQERLNITSKNKVESQEIIERKLFLEALKRKIKAYKKTLINEQVETIRRLDKLSSQNKSSQNTEIIENYLRNLFEKQLSNLKLSSPEVYSSLMETDVFKTLSETEQNVDIRKPSVSVENKLNDDYHKSVNIKPAELSQTSENNDKSLSEANINKENLISNGMELAKTPLENVDKTIVSDVTSNTAIKDLENIDNETIPENIKKTFKQPVDKDLMKKSLENYRSHGFFPSKKEFAVKLNSQFVSNEVKMNFDKPQQNWEKRLNAQVVPIISKTIDNLIGEESPNAQSVKSHPAASLSKGQKILQKPKLYQSFAMAKRNIYTDVFNSDKASSKLPENIKKPTEFKIPSSPKLTKKSIRTSPAAPRPIKTKAEDTSKFTPSDVILGHPFNKDSTILSSTVVTNYIEKKYLDNAVTMQKATEIKNAHSTKRLKQNQQLLNEGKISSTQQIIKKTKIKPMHKIYKEPKPISFVIKESKPALATKVQKETPVTLVEKEGKTNINDQVQNEDKISSDLITKPSKNGPLAHLFNDNKIPPSSRPKILQDGNLRQLMERIDGITAHINKVNESSQKKRKPMLKDKVLQLRRKRKVVKQLRTKRHNNDIKPQKRDYKNVSSETKFSTLMGIPAQEIEYVHEILNPPCIERRPFSKGNLLKVFNFKTDKPKVKLNSLTKTQQRYYSTLNSVNGLKRNNDCFNFQMYIHPKHLAENNPEYKPLYEYKPSFYMPNKAPQVKTTKPCVLLNDCKCNETPYLQKVEKTKQILSNKDIENEVRFHIAQSKLHSTFSPKCKLTHSLDESNNLKLNKVEKQVIQLKKMIVKMLRKDMLYGNHSSKAPCADINLSETIENQELQPSLEPILDSFIPSNSKHLDVYKMTSPNKCDQYLDTSIKLGCEESFSQECATVDPKSIFTNTFVDHVWDNTTLQSSKLNIDTKKDSDTPNYWSDPNIFNSNEKVDSKWVSEDSKCSSKNRYLEPKIRKSDSSLLINDNNTKYLDGKSGKSVNWSSLKKNHLQKEGSIETLIEELYQASKTEIKNLANQPSDNLCKKLQVFRINNIFNKLANKLNYPQTSDGTLTDSQSQGNLKESIELKKKYNGQTNVHDLRKEESESVSVIPLKENNSVINIIPTGQELQDNLERSFIENKVSLPNVHHISERSSSSKDIMAEQENLKNRKLGMPKFYRQTIMSQSTTEVIESGQNSWDLKQKKSLDSVLDSTNEICDLKPNENNKASPTNCKSCSARKPHSINIVKGLENFSPFSASIARKNNLIQKNVILPRRSSWDGEKYSEEISEDEVYAIPYSEHSATQAFHHQQLGLYQNNTKQQQDDHSQYDDSNEEDENFMERSFYDLKLDHPEAYWNIENNAATSRTLEQIKHQGEKFENMARKLKLPLLSIDCEQTWYTEPSTQRRK